MKAFVWCRVYKLCEQKFGSLFMQNACFRTCCRALLNDWWKRPLKESSKRTLKHFAVPRPAVHPNKKTQPTPRNSANPSLGRWWLLIFWCQLFFIASAWHTQQQYLAVITTRQRPCLSAWLPPTGTWQETPRGDCHPRQRELFSLSTFVTMCLQSMCVLSERNDLAQTRSRGLNLRSERSYSSPSVLGCRLFISAARCGV